MDTAKHGQGSEKAKDGIRKVSLWTRLSPMNLFRMIRDSYVSGCVTFGNSSKVNAIAQSSAVRVVTDENVAFSRSNSRSVRDDLASAQELLDLSIQLSRGVLEQPAGRTTHLITDHNGLTLSDLEGYSGTLHKTGASGKPLRDSHTGHSGQMHRARPSFDAVPESEQYTDTSLPFAFTRSCSERPPPHRLHARPYAKPLTPVTDMSTFREQPNGPLKSYIPLPRASSRRRERFGGTTSASLNSLNSTTLVKPSDLPRSRSGSATKPNPYSFYDTRLSSST